MTPSMIRSSLVGLAIVMAASIGAALAIRSTPARDGAPSMGLANVRAASSSSTVDTTIHVSPASSPIDPIPRYLAMRDDTNRVPRLALIEDYARSAGPDASTDLFAQAMLDPDEAVRSRAQDLFDRAIAARRTARLAHTDS